MAFDFKAATHTLFMKLGPEELAGELDCSAQTIRQARMDPDKPGYRAPPQKWEAAVALLARHRARQLLKLAERVETLNSES